LTAEVRFLLWDFGDTLVDEGFFATCPRGVPDWTDVIRAVAGGPFGTRWNRGTAGLDDLAAEMSARLGMTPEAVLAHARQCCADIRFFEHAWAAARSRVFPQAIVTVNPDLFRDLIVPNYELDAVFDTIVISAEEGTDNKADLCAIAAARLGSDDPAHALLIDNIEANVDEWRSRGGTAYWFRGDAEFASRLRAVGWNGLAAHS
jgi:beta-phosphoglucomutase-like phosphatase (HAD superfamily)